MRATVVMWLELCLGLHLTPHCFVYMHYNEEFSHTRERALSVGLPPDNIISAVQVSA